jgi:hypothetical protein
MVPLGIFQPSSKSVPGRTIASVYCAGQSSSTRYSSGKQILADTLAIQIGVGQVPDPCDLHNPASVETVTLGSENVGVGRSKPFAIYQSDNVALQGGANCVCK